MEFLNLQIEERTKIFINNALLTNRGFIIMLIGQMLTVIMSSW